MRSPAPSGFAQGDIVTLRRLHWQISSNRRTPTAAPSLSGNDIALMAVPEPNSSPVRAASACSRCCAGDGECWMAREKSSARLAPFHLSENCKLNTSNFFYPLPLEGQNQGRRTLRIFVRRPTCFQPSHSVIPGLYRCKPMRPLHRAMRTLAATRLQNPSRQRRPE